MITLIITMIIYHSDRHWCNILYVLGTTGEEREVQE